MTMLFYVSSACVLLAVAIPRLFSMMKLIPERAR